MDEAQRAYVYVLKVLSRRDHSEAELRGKLTGRGISPDTAEETIGRLKQSGYLDDRRFALHWAESAIRNGRGYGFRLRCELSRRGISQEIASQVAEQVSAAYDEAETIKALVARKFPRFAADSADDRQKRRIVGYLQRRGFSLAAVLKLFHDMEE